VGVRVLARREDLLRFGVPEVLGRARRGRVVSGVVDGRVRAVIEQQPDHLDVPAHRRFVQRGGPGSRVDVELELDQQPDRRQIVLLGRPGEQLRPALDRTLAQPSICRKQPVHDVTVAGHRSRDQLIDLIVLPGRARADEQRDNVHVTSERCLLHRCASLIDGVLRLPALGINPAGQQPADPVGEAVTGRSDQQVLDHLAT
jgi:hypothetical protein